MRILQINCVYKFGSTGKIVDCISLALRERGHDVLTCYGIGDDYYDEHSKKICSNLEHKANALLMRISGIPYGGLFLSNQRFYRIIESYKPDVVHVHCINASMINVYQLFKYLGRKKIKTVVTLHAEIFHTAGCEHAFDCEKFKTFCHDCNAFKQKRSSWFFDRSRTAWQKMYDAFNSFDPKYLSITAVSPWLVRRAKQSSILKNYDVTYVPNGVDCSMFYYRDLNGVINKEYYQKTILHVTAGFSLNETDQKGGHFIPELARLMPDCKFVIVAGTSFGAFYKLPSNVQFWGRAKSQDELAQLYSEADATLILSRRETFSMVTAESLCCGTPVVGFKAGGPESIAIEEYSSFVEYGNLQALSDALRLCSETTIEKKEISNKAVTLYSKETMANKYLAEYRKLFIKPC